MTPVELIQPDQLDLTCPLGGQQIGAETGTWEAHQARRRHVEAPAVIDEPGGLRELCLSVATRQASLGDPASLRAMLSVGSAILMTG